MGGTHTCAVSVTAQVPGSTDFTGVGFGTAVNGVIPSVTVTLLPAGGNNPGPITLQGLPCPLSGSLTVTLPGAESGITLVITAVD
ncbi:hypothetical protein ASE51_27175 [Bacillus sp. Root147]|uniref:hypothetical protein n=1 Tax=Priestia megaterium TaxID=1404 RepID=UPI00070ABCE7|nr:hypothetical protein [Priestia megaterium]KRD85874.1 hypothetical protein ASE51_27175 [Bacillus sp. Root147]MBD8848096.1 hypothetical protein [Priestia megaterium]